MAAYVVDNAVDRFGRYVEGRITEYRQKLEEQMDRQKPRAGKGNRQSSGAQEAKRREEMKEAVERFARALRTGEPMDTPTESRKPKRSLGELMG